MKKPEIKKSFNNRKFKYGGYATLITVAVIAILVVVNLLVGKFNWKVDMTKNKMYSLSDQTYKVLDNLKSNIKMYVFYETGNEDPAVKTIIEQYQSRSKKISVEYKDPVKYPQFAKQFASNGAQVSQGSIVVQSGSKFKLIDPNDFINYSYDASGRPKADSLAIEQKITGAIINVTSSENPVILALKGHEEPSLPSSVTNQLESENYVLKDLDLLLKDSKLTQGSVLLVNSPRKDLTADEAATIKDFLSKGGKAVFLMDIVNSDMPNFQSVLNTYGVGIKKSIVVESNPNYSTQNPLYLVPEIGSQEIVSPLKSSNMQVLIPGAQVIETLKLKKSSTTIEPLLTTSKDSWGKVNLKATNANKEPGDYDGPFNVAVAITDTLSDGSDNSTKLVVVSNGLFIDADYANVGGNTDFFMNSINWLQDKKDSISIRPKSLDSGDLSMNGVQRLLFSGVTVILIPGIITVLGISVWLRRRHS